MSDTLPTVTLHDDTVVMLSSVTIMLGNADLMPVLTCDELDMLARQPLNAELADDGFGATWLDGSEHAYRKVIVHRFEWMLAELPEANIYFERLRINVAPWDTTLMVVRRYERKYFASLTA